MLILGSIKLDVDNSRLPYQRKIDRTRRFHWDKMTV